MLSVSFWDKKISRWESFQDILVMHEAFAEYSMRRISVVLRMNKLVLRALAIVFILSAIYSCGASDKKHSKKDPSEVLNDAPFEGLTDSIKSFPDSPELYLHRAYLLSQNNLQELATPDYKKAWELTKDENVGLEYISNLLLTEHLSESVALLKEGVEKFPDNLEYNRRLAEVYLQKGEPANAMEQYNLIIGKDSFNFEAWHDKGALLAKLKDTSEAVKALETSFAIMPINYSGMALANIYAARKNPRALVICNFLLEKDSGEVQTEPLYMKGVYYSEIKKYDSALKQFDLCIRRDWKMTDAYIEKGIILFEQRKMDSAMKIFNMAATVSNTDADAYYWMGRCFEAVGDKQQAAANYDRAYALDNTFSEAHQGLERVTK